MPKVNDLTGLRINRWTVLKRDGHIGKRTAWLAQCSCGTQKTVAGQQLTSGRSMSCGCLKAELASQRLCVDLTGQVFGRLTVLSKNGKTNCNNQKWLCQCSCGNQTTVAAAKLKRKEKATVSCGCYQKEQKLIRNNVDVTGQQFGELTALQPSADKFQRGGSRFWDLRCSCGSIHRTRLTALQQGKTKSCGCMKNEFIGKAHTHDLTGKTFNRLTVIGKAHRGTTGRREQYWLAQCECGNTHKATAGALTSGVCKSCGCLKAGDDSLAGWFTDKFRTPEADSFFYVFNMANHADLSKPGITNDLEQRVRCSKDEYGDMHDFIALPRIEAWLLEQAVLFDTRQHWECPDELLLWGGHSELRRLAPAALFEMACGYHEQLQLLGREEFAIRYLPTTPKQREQLEAMKPQLVAA